MRWTSAPSGTWRGAWGAVVQRVAKSQTRLSDQAHTYTGARLRMFHMHYFHSTRQALAPRQTVSRQIRVHESSYAPQYFGFLWSTSQQNSFGYLQILELTDT